MYKKEVANTSTLESFNSIIDDLKGELLLFVLIQNLSAKMISGYIPVSFYGLLVFLGGILRPYPAPKGVHKLPILISLPVINILLGLHSSVQLCVYVNSFAFISVVF